MNYTPEDLGSEQLVYTGSVDVMPLRGQSSQVLNIPQGSTARFQWAPSDRRASTVEVKAQIQSYKLSPFDYQPGVVFPDVRYRLTFGHGQYTYTDPLRAAQSDGNSTPPQLKGYTLPARGIVLRLTVRELIVEFETSQVDNVIQNTQILLSFMPVATTDLPTYGDSSEGHGLIRDTGIQVFPAWAKEWRLRDFSGQPFAAGTNDLLLYRLGGWPFLENPFDRADYSEWSPITSWMFGWNATTSTRGMASYR
jgi:hypothetical protein